MKYITRTIETYDTKVVFVSDNEITTFELVGEVGRKEAKRKLAKMGYIDAIIISVNKVIRESHIYRMPVVHFIENAEMIK